MTTWLNALIVTARHEAEEHESWGVVRAVHAGVRREGSLRGESVPEKSKPKNHLKETLSS